MSLRAHLVLRRTGFDLDVALDVAPGEVVALLGPNGAGKTTVLRTLAGLERLVGGSVSVDGDPLDDVSAGVHVPVESRSVGVVFQHVLLFPHLSVLENVAFGLRCQGRSRGSARARAQAWLDRLGVGELGGRRPGGLSGGQAQRVAVARALAPAPRLLLLDEPLSALDARTRLLMRSELAGHLGEFGGCAVVVTHDPIDAMVLGDRMVVLEHGRIVQQGGPSEIARHPRTQYVARLVGLNLYRGVARGPRVQLDEGGAFTVAASLSGEVFVALRPQAVAVHRDRPLGSPHNVWAVRVVGLERLADICRVELAGQPPVVADVPPAAVAELGLTPGTRVWVAVKASEATAYPV